MNHIINFARAVTFVSPPVELVKLEGLGIIKEANIKYSTIVVRTSLVAVAAFTLFFPVAQLCVLPPLAWAAYDINRCAKICIVVLDGLYAKMFEINPEVSKTTLDYLIKSPNAIRKMIGANCDFNKVGIDGLTLLGNLVQNVTREGRRNDYSDKAILEAKATYEVFQLILDQGVKLTSAQFLRLVEHNEKFAEYALASNKFTAVDLTENELLICWQKNPGYRLACKLVDKGFCSSENIDSKESPLIMKLLNRLTETKLLTLLKAGARIPKIESVYTTQDGVARTFGEYLSDRPTIKAIIDQAKGAKEQFNLIGRPDRVEGRSIFTDMDIGIFDVKKPLLRTALDGSSFEINSFSIDMRVFAVAMPVFTVTIALSVIYFSFAPLLLLAIPVAYYKYEWSRATKALNSLAVNEFKTVFPSKAAVAHVINAPVLFDELGDNYKKINDRGDTLWQMICRDSFFDRNYTVFKELTLHQKIALFKKVTDKMFVEGLSEEEKALCLREVKQSPHRKFLEYFQSKFY